MAFRVQIRRDTTANWAATNPVLLEAELALDYTRNCLKIGDGVTRWNSLPYFVCLGGSGTAGSSGTSGTSGSGTGSGTSGTSGSSGTRGTSGSSGSSGSSGAAGASGSSGTSGSSGASGSSGTSGISGVNGTSGSSGTSGVTVVQNISATGGSTPINLNLAGITKLTLTVSTEISLTVSSPGIYTIQVVQGSGGQTLTYANTIYWIGANPPTLTATAGYSDVITLIYNGSILLGTYDLNFHTP